MSTTPFVSLDSSGRAGESAYPTWPDFSGSWKPNLAKSNLQIPPPDYGLFVIEHHEPHFRLTRTLVFGEHSDTITIEFVIDGKEQPLNLPGTEAQVRAHWEESTLVAHMDVRRSDDAGTNDVRYSLEDEGRTFVALESWRSAKQNYDNVWTFDRFSDGTP